MKSYPVKLEVREDADGWRLFALPCHNLGWAPVPMTQHRGTAGGALVEFASALYRLTMDEASSSDARFTDSAEGKAIGSANNRSSSPPVVPGPQETFIGVDWGKDRDWSTTYDPTGPVLRRAEGPTTNIADPNNHVLIADSTVPPAAPGAEDATHKLAWHILYDFTAENQGRGGFGPTDVERVIEQLRAPSPAPAAGSAWQDISTAPKDGTKVMVYGCEWRRHVYGTGYYFKGVPGDGEGWIAHSFYTAPQDDARGSFTPTHWQPLPSPPSASVLPSERTEEP